MRFIKHSILLLLSGLIFVACSNKKKQVDETNNKTPSTAGYVEQARFTDFEGNAVTISDFEGKVILIDFWETWCKPCLISFPTMQKAMEEYPDDFVVLAVTPGFADTKEDAQRFIAHNDYEFVYLWDENNLSKKLGIQGIPFKVYVDAEGNFIKASMGISGDKNRDYQELTSIIEKHKS